MIKKLAASLREYKKDTILTPIMMVGEVTCECIIPVFTASLLNSIQEGKELNVILKYGFLLLAMAMLSLLFGCLSGWFCASASAGFAKNLRKDLFYRVQGFSFTNIDNFSTSSLVTRLTTDITNVQNSFMMIIRTAVRSPLMLIFSFFISFKVGGKLAWVFVLTIPVLGIALFTIIRKTMPIFRRVFKQYDALNESVQENIKGIRVVKSFVREEHEKEKFGKASDDVRGSFVKAESILALNGPVMNFCMYLSMIVISFFAAKIIITSGGTEMQIGSLTSMITYSMQILMSLMMLSMIFVMITMSAESARRLCEVLNEKSTLTTPESPVYKVADGSIEFTDVNFKYSEKAERMSLFDIDLKIEAGQTVGIIGGTGSGKSTLIQLIPRLYDATTGTVKVGGVDVTKYDLKTLRDEVSVVLQKNVLFSGTIKENLRWGCPDASDEELVRICKLAQADEFIQGFPDKYDTYIEQGGANVSGGQKQRLCIARALLKKPKILILDDSTSAVDTRTDAFIRKAFREEIPDTTKIIIAQRIASIQESDLIVVMNNGSIDAVGTHEELLKT
ncbi:MAG: ABC transporter ATP-binding protein, partial [Lachnospiraceae bacterium]|nr:ABC transporter ATP-binding protein [Lachnospiraceae bacterium]